MKWPSFKRRRVLLYVMNLEDMVRVHPAMDTAHVCMKCGQRVGIYPSGQAVLKKFGSKRVDVVCNRCGTPPVGSLLAPGAEQELGESRPAD